MPGRESKFAEQMEKEDFSTCQDLATIALLDVGTVSLRFEIYNVLLGNYRSSPSLSIKRVHKERLMLRLGAGLYSEGVLNVKAKAATEAAFTSVRKRLAHFPGAHVCAAATSAFREASDGPSFILGLSELLGAEVRIISGEDEAKITAEGILAYEEIPAAPFFLIDIGGGSTEITLCDGGRVLECDSLPLGAIRCHEMFLRTVPSEMPTQSAVAELRARIRELLALSLPRSSRPAAIGSSASVKTLSRLVHRDLTADTRPVSKEQVDAMVRNMLPLTVEQIAALPGMEKNRADIALAGALIIQEAMDYFEAKELKPTLFSLRHGLLHRKVLELLAESH